MTSLGVFLGGVGVFLFGIASIWRVSLEDKNGVFKRQG